MPQIAIITIESTINWLVIFIFIYMYIYVTYFIYPIISLLKINYYILFDRLCGILSKSKIVKNKKLNVFSASLIQGYWETIKSL